MFTVVVTEQTHLDSIHEYRSFLKPFLDKSQIAFCRWRPDGRDLTEAVPELYEKVARHERWRLIVVCDEEGLGQKNPFELVKPDFPERQSGMDDAQYLSLCHKAKEEAYRQAAKKPLVRLMTWMCQQPLVSDTSVPDLKDDPEFAEYVASARMKEQLRKEILGGFVSEIALPSEVICLAKRCFGGAEYDIRNAWNTRQDFQYSRFYDWNLYFDRMRYLIFDILPKNHRNYTFDYIRFLYALMVLAENETPLAALNPNRVYCLDCQNDEEALKELLLRYDEKLLATKELLQSDIRKLEGTPQPRLSDRDAEMIFCNHQTVPVAISADFDRDTLYLNRDGIGLSTDCPSDEENAWQTGTQRTRKALAKFLKQPRRALKKSAGDLRRVNTADLDQVGQLNEFQLEDVADHVAEEELKMVSQHTSDLYDMDRYNKDLDAQRKRVSTLIRTRMTKRRTLILGLVAMLCFAVGYLPLFFGNLGNGKSRTWSLIIMGIGVGIMLIASLIILWFLRKPLRAGYSDYNGIMHGVVKDVEQSMTDYTLYLSHACNVMRGFSVLNYRAENEDPVQVRVRVLKKHAFDLERTRQEMREIFGAFLPDTVTQVDGGSTYTYDFSRPVDFAYPIPYTTDQARSIEFLQKGNLVTVPVNFVKCLGLRREELYD